MPSAEVANMIPVMQRFFAAQPVKRAYLFGSCSRGEERSDSDATERKGGAADNIRLKWTKLGSRKNAREEKNEKAVPIMGQKRMMKTLSQ